MTRYIGIDAHLESCTVAVMGKSGRRLRQERVETNAKLLRALVQQVPRPRLMCIEEGMLCEWLYEELEPLVDELVVTMGVSNRGNKSDALDAWNLADMLRRDAVQQPVYKQPGRFRQLREAVRGYNAIKKDVRRAKQRLAALTNSCGRPVPAKLLYDGRSRAESVEGLPYHYRPRALLYGRQLDHQVSCALEATKLLRQAAGNAPIVKRISTAPGLGLIRASNIVAVVITPHRFRTKKQFWQYCGLGIVQRSSSNWTKDGAGWKRKAGVQTRGLNRNRHPLMKDAFKGAAQSITTMKDHPLAQHYRKLLETTKPNLAQLTIARRLAAAVLAMWKNKEDYDASRHCRRPAPYH